MFSDLPALLWCVLPGAAIGLVLGYGLQYIYPKEMGEHAQHCRSASWWVYGLYALMFAALAAWSAFDGRWSFATFFVLFGLLQVAAAVVNHCYPPKETMENKS